MMHRLSEPKFRRLDVFYEFALKNFLSQKKPALNFVEFLHFYNKILTKFALIFY